MKYVDNYKKGINWKDIKPGNTLYVQETINGFNHTYYGMVDSIVNSTKVKLTNVKDITQTNVVNHENIIVSMKNCYLQDKDGCAHWFNALGNCETGWKENQPTDEHNQEHPSYGMLSISKYSGHSDFFGSAIHHEGGISLKIHQAKYERSLSGDHYYPGSVPLIEVQMSYNQFAEAITAGMNTSGTPCTISYFNGEHIPIAVFQNKRKQFNNEFEHEMKILTEKMDKLTKNTEEILNKKGTISKGEKDLIKKQIDSLKMEINSNIPFLNTQFNRQIDKTVTEAKSEIEGFYESKVRSLGIDAVNAIGMKKPKMIEDKE